MFVGVGGGVLRSGAFCGYIFMLLFIYFGGIRPNFVVWSDEISLKVKVFF